MIICIVQARMGSERLHAKVLKEIIGKPMILHVLDRLKQSVTIDKIVMATSTNKNNDPLVQCVEQAGYSVFRGSENNVLERFNHVVEKFGGDTIVRITGDCPLIDPQIVDKVIGRFNNENLDYIRLDVPQSFIPGFDVEVFSKESLNKTALLANDPKYIEHVTYYIYTHQDEFAVGFEKGDNFYNKDYRLCVDTQADLNLVTNIFKHFNDPYVQARDVVEYLDSNPTLSKINSETPQKNV